MPGGGPRRGNADIESDPLPFDKRQPDADVLTEVIEHVLEAAPGSFCPKLIASFAQRL